MILWNGNVLVDTTMEFNTERPTISLVAPFVGKASENAMLPDEIQVIVKQLK